MTFPTQLYRDNNKQFSRSLLTNQDSMESKAVPETKSEFTPENGWSWNTTFLLGKPIFRCYCWWQPEIRRENHQWWWLNPIKNRYIYICYPPLKSLPFLWVSSVQTAERFLRWKTNSVKTIIFVRMQQMVPESAVQESWTYFDPSFIIKLLSFQNKI